MCTITSIDVTPIDVGAYGDGQIEDERNAFRDGEIEFYQLNEDAYGFARNYGGKSLLSGYYIHNRLFREEEDPGTHLQLTGTGNTADQYTKATLLRGTRLAVGYINHGRGMQARVSAFDIDKMKFYASHSIAARPSNLIAKVAHILEWFEKYRTADD